MMTFNEPSYILKYTKAKYAQAHVYLCMPNKLANVTLLVYLACQFGLYLCVSTTPLNKQGVSEYTKR